MTLSSVSRMYFSFLTFGSLNLLINYSWDYKYIIVSDEEKRFRDIIKEKDLEIDAKFGALEKVIELQNRATIMAVESVMKGALENVKDVINEKKLEGLSTPVFEEAEFYKGKF